MNTIVVAKSSVYILLYMDQVLQGTAFGYRSRK
jgi:hypothetical protein